MRVNELLKYDFIIRLLFIYFSDRDVWARLLITCKSIRRFISHTHRIKQELVIDQALFIAQHYWPEMITRIYFVEPHQMVQLVRFPSLCSISLSERYEPFDMNLVPSSVTHMTRVVPDCQFDITWFPTSITSLCVTVRGGDDDLIPDTLPPQLKSLKLIGDDGFFISAGLLPNGLTELDIEGYVHNCSLTCNELPSTLLSLTFRTQLEFDTTFILPESHANILTSHLS